MQKLEKLSARPRKRKTTLLPPGNETLNQWKAKRNEAVGDSKTCAQTQTDDGNFITDETTQNE